MGADKEQGRIAKLYPSQRLLAYLVPAARAVTATAMGT